METSYTPKALTAEQLQLLTKEVKQALTELYGSRLDRVILYGSYARGDFHAESDVDFLVVLKDQEVKSTREIWKMGNQIGDLSYRFDVFISAKAIAISKFLTSDLLFYRNIHREGLVL